MCPAFHGIQFSSATRGWSCGDVRREYQNDDRLIRLHQTPEGRGDGLHHPHRERQYGERRWTRRHGAAAHRERTRAQSQAGRRAKMRSHGMPHPGLSHARGVQFDVQIGVRIPPGTGVRIPPGFPRPAEHEHRNAELLGLDAPRDFFALAVLPHRGRVLSRGLQYGSNLRHQCRLDASESQRHHEDY